MIILKIEADLHTHTIASGHAYSTVEELAKSASQRGLKLFAVTDHGIALPGGPHLYHFTNMGVLPEKIHGVRVLKGVEANILGNGNIDMGRRLLHKLDFVAAGLHSNTGHNFKNMKEYTDAIINVMKNPFVNMITHPVNRYFPTNLERVVLAAKKYGIILELNAGSYCRRKNSSRGVKEMSIKLAQLAQKHHVYLSLNSDAHYHDLIGDVSALDFVLNETQIDEEIIINSSAERILSFLDYQKEEKKSAV